jgi:LAGLIDADG endonuclease
MVANLWTPQHAGPRNSIDIASYISGYFDGEGCFSVAIGPRPQIRVGWEVRPSVSVSQNADRDQVLELVIDYFGCGTIRPDPGDHTLKWETRRLHDIVNCVLPHFERYPVISAKQEDVDLLATICQMMLQQQHLRRQGLLRIAELAAQMNPSGSRRYSIEQIAASAR